MSDQTKWKVRLSKYGSIWHYFTTNPQGGGFGSSHRGSKRVALNLAMRNIPQGSTVEITVYHASTKINTVTTVV